jgi:16S rRNA C1402 (ribose-2'-O) methylase RsmI
VVKCLEQFVETFGAERPVSVSRELTKKFEQTVRGTAGEVLEHFRRTEPRGEFVLVVAGAEEKAEEGCTFEAALDLVRARMAEGLSTKDAVKQVAKLTGFAKNLLYDAVVK